jgi:hypothetical protein
MQVLERIYLGLQAVDAVHKRLALRCKQLFQFFTIIFDGEVLQSNCGQLRQVFSVKTAKASPYLFCFGLKSYFQRFNLSLQRLFCDLSLVQVLYCRKEGHLKKKSTTQSAIIFTAPSLKTEASASSNFERNPAASSLAASCWGEMGRKNVHNLTISSTFHEMVEHFTCRLKLSRSEFAVFAARLNVWISRAKSI